MSPGAEHLAPGNSGARCWYLAPDFHVQIREGLYEKWSVKTFIAQIDFDTSLHFFGPYFFKFWSFLDNGPITNVALGVFSLVVNLGPFVASRACSCGICAVKR